MKKSILNSLVLLFIVSASFANNNPESHIKLDNQKVFVSLSNADQTNIISSVNYNEQEKNLEFVMNSDISHVQIFNAQGELEFQIFVDSKKLKLGSSLFEKGDYKLGFLMKESKKSQFTKLTIK